MTIYIVSVTVLRTAAVSCLDRFIEMRILCRQIYRYSGIVYENADTFYVCDLVS